MNLVLRIVFNNDGEIVEEDTISLERIKEGETND